MWLNWFIRSIVFCTTAIVLAGCASQVAQHDVRVFDEAALLRQCQPANGATPARCDFAPALIGDARHYRVEMTIKPASTPWVYAESRRLMHSSAIAIEQQILSFLVNTRHPDGQPLQQDTYQGSPGLTLWLPGELHEIEQIAITAITPDKRLFILGDSTVCDQNPQWEKPAIARYSGWGQVLPAYLSQQVSVVNYADSGEGTQAFNIEDGELFAPIAEQLREKDIVLIQLGHNDKTTSAAVYEQRLSDLLLFIKARGALPILVSPMIRNQGINLAQQHQWPQLDVRRSLQKISQLQDIPLIDLMALSDAWVTELGQMAAQQFFVPKDRTHSNEAGAHLFASMLVEDITRRQLPLAEYVISR